MGMVRVTVEGWVFRYYDNYGTVCGPGGDVIGRLDIDSLNVYRYEDDDDEERRRSDALIEGRVRAIALAWLKTHPDPTVSS